MISKMITDFKNVYYNFTFLWFNQLALSTCKPPAVPSQTAQETEKVYSIS